jgi:hypothetical protein
MIEPLKPGAMGYVTPKWHIGFYGEDRTKLDVMVNDGLAPASLGVHELEALIDTLAQMKWVMEQAVKNE